MSVWIDVNVKARKKRILKFILKKILFEKKVFLDSVNIIVCKFIKKYFQAQNLKLFAQKNVDSFVFQALKGPYSNIVI